MAADASLVADHVLEFPGGYTRSVGPVVGRFLAGLRERRLLGVRTTEGRVLVPPTEYDPQTSAALGGSDEDFCEVGPCGTVTTWAWVAEPLRNHPLQRPFAWALIRLDGADTAMLHAVDAPGEDALRTGMRVRPRWRADRVGHLLDIECFEPSATPVTGAAAAPAIETEPERLPDPIAEMNAPTRLDYRIGAGKARTRFLRGLAEGRMRGQRCPVCQQVYLPPRGACPTCGVATNDEVDLPLTGTVTTFCVVNIKFSPRAPELPYVCAHVLIDGAHTPLIGLVAGIGVRDVRMGLRVRAVFVPPEELKPTMESVKWFEPTGEPDAAFDAYKEYL